MTKQDISISIADDHLDRFPEVVKSLREAGFDVSQELATLGVVTGSADSAKLGDLRQVAGVSAVEPAETFQLPPADDPLQ